MKVDYIVKTMEIEGLLIEVESPAQKQGGNTENVSDMEVEDTIRMEILNESDADRKKRFGAMCTAIRKASGMKRPDYAKWLGIPYRTYQDWELGNSQVPEYVLRLMAYKVKMEGLLKKGELVYAEEKDNN